MAEEQARIKACPHCGSVDVFPKLLVGGPLAGVDSKNGSYVCLTCGREAVPLHFTDYDEWRSFFTGTPIPKEEEGAGRFAHIPILPVDTVALFAIGPLELPVGKVAEVVSIEWDGSKISRTEYGAPFERYWNAVGGRRYNASGILLMDLSGMRESKPNFKVLKDLVRKKENVWLDIGMRSVQDLFDSFAMEVSKAIASTLTATGIGMFRDVFELSDQCIPCVYVDDEVKWARPNGNPLSLKETVRAMNDIGYREVAIIDLRRLGSRQGVSRDFASEALGFDMDVFVGGGVMETDIEFLRQAGAAGALLDPHTPVIRDLLGSEERPLPTEDIRSEPVRTTRPRELPCD